MQTPIVRHLSLSSSEQALIAQAERFAQQHLSHVESQQPSRFYRELLVQACEAGLAAIEVPADQGGAGASFAARARVCEVLAQQHAGFAFSLVNHHNVIVRIARQGNAVARERWLATMLSGEQIGCTAMTEPQSGSDFTSMRTVARRDGDGWILNGAKDWITNTAYADVFLVYAQTDPDAGARGIAGFLVDAGTPGFERGEIHAGFGTEGIGAGAFQLHDVRVGPESLIYSPGDGFLAAMRGVNDARTYVAAINAAMMDSALQTACRYTESRQAFGKPLSGIQGVGWPLATVATHLQALYLLVDTGIQAIVAQQDAQGIAAMAKKYANEHAGPAIAACMQAMGARGLLPEYRLDRFLSWARAFCYTDGTPEMMNERIVHVLRKPYRQ